jgi:hypothetical protein
MIRAITTFHLILIKPTHYDADGYPIQWLRNWIASNSLACLNALALDCRDRKVLGPEVKIEVHAMDEICQRVPTKKLLNRVKRDGGRALEHTSWDSPVTPLSQSVMTLSLSSVNSPLIPYISPF